MQGEKASMITFICLKVVQTIHATFNEKFFKELADKIHLCCETRTEEI